MSNHSNFSNYRKDDWRGPTQNGHTAVEVGFDRFYPTAKDGERDIDALGNTIEYKTFTRRKNICSCCEEIVEETVEGYSGCCNKTISHAIEITGPQAVITFD